MTQKIARTDTDYNTLQWQGEQVSIALQSQSHVHISRFKHRLSHPRWTISIDVTSGHRMLRAACGNRLVCVNDDHLLALTSGEYVDGGSQHNHHLHYIHPEGRILWSRPWETIQRFTMIANHLLVLRYTSPPTFWINTSPLEAHLLDPATGKSIYQESITIPETLRPHYQSWQVNELKTYLVWKQDQLVMTVRPYFQPQYLPAHRLSKRGSFKHTLQFNGFGTAS